MLRPKLPLPQDLAVPFDDDDAIDVDESLDQLTELIVVPRDSPFRSVRRAIVLAPRRPALLVMPEPLEPRPRSPALRPASVPPGQPGTRTMQLTPFAARPAQRRGATSC
jgi:hypothetical protein